MLYLEDVIPHLAKPLPDAFIYDVIPLEVRHQARYIILEVYKPSIEQQPFMGSLRSDALGHVREAVLREFGEPALVNSIYSPYEDAWKFLIEFRNEHLARYLYFLGMAFRLATLLEAKKFFNGVEDAVIDLNTRFRRAGIGYELDFRTGVIHRIDNVVTHQEAIKPVLSLLTNRSYATANSEFLEALEHYKAGRNGDCLTHCAKAFESVMKIICHEKGWLHDSNGNASHLIDAIFEQCPSIPTYLKAPIFQVANMRNKLGPHGKGIQPNDPVANHIAQYSINGTASAILFLVDATK